MNELVTLDNNKYSYQDLLKKAGTFGQSSYSDENFMLKENHTPHRQLRQVLMHYDGICYTLLNYQNKQKQTNIEKEELQNKIDELQDAINRNKTLATNLKPEKDMTQFDKKSYELKIQKLQTKIKEKEIGEAQSKKLVDDALESKANYEKMLSEIIPRVEKLENEGITFEESEKEYWKRRFTEEAKLDIFIKENNIPIDKQTIKSIFRMDENSREETFEAIGVPSDIMDQLGIDYINDDIKLLNQETINLIEEN